MNRVRYFVPVNFSECSYKAAEYAILLAKSCEGSVMLFHAVDAQEIEGSENPLVVSQSVDRLITKAESRLRAVCDMISETWDLKVSYSVSIGKVESCVLSEIDKTKPDVIVVGKNGHWSSLLKKVLGQACLPIFVVPATSKIQEPSSIVFTTDLRPVHPKILEPLLQLTHSTTRAFSLLHISQMGGRNGKKLNGWVAQLSRQLGKDVQILQEHYDGTASGIINHLQSNCADLICTVKREKGLFSNFFSKSVSIELAMLSEVPTLVMTEKSALEV